jgi:chromosome segregation ATPase
MSQAGAAVAYDQTPTPKIKATPRERALMAEVSDLRADLQIQKDRIVELSEDVASATAEAASAQSEADDARLELSEAQDQLAAMDEHITALVRVRNLLASGDTRDALREIEDVLHHLDSAWSTRGTGVL